MNAQPFSPSTTQICSATTSSASASMQAGLNCVRLHNAGPNLAFVRMGVSGQTAVATDMPLPVGNTEVFCKGLADTLAAICAAGSATVYVTSGEGQ